ncbi:MAG: SPOR domain-containing protein [Acidobacteria bacterium]|nr:SPOR domain-containing protein [Acidobacteriota bacterium]
MPGKYFEIIVSGRQLAAFVAGVAILILGCFGLGVVVGLQQPATVHPEPVPVADLTSTAPTFPAPAFDPYPSPAPAATLPPIPLEAAPPPTADAVPATQVPEPPVPTAAPPTAVPPTPTEAAPTAAPASAGRWVQVAALSRKDQADGVRTRVMAAGYTAGQVVVLPASAGKYRVRLGPFPDEESAKRVAARLTAGDFPGAFVVRE